jgi:HlyD family secretion protein
MKKKTILIVGLVVVVLAALVIFQMNSSNKRGTQVHAAVAKTTDIIERVSASGRIQPQTKVNITAQINGKIVALSAKEGDTVRPGQLLAVLDTVQLKSEAEQGRYTLNEISARLDGAKSSLDQASEEYERQQKLNARNLTSETQLKASKYAYLNAKANYEATSAQSNQLQSAYEKQLDNLSKTKIVAPMAGVLTLVDCEVGEIAPAQTAFTQGKTLMTISNLDIFEVEVEVDETEIGKVRMEQVTKVEIDAFPDTTFKGKVVEIGNTAILKGSGTQDQSTNFKVKVILVDADGRIRPGMSATVDITTNEKKEALSIPFSAVVIRQLDMDSLLASRQHAAAESSGGVQAAGTDSSIMKPKEDKKKEDLKGVFVISGGKLRFEKIQTGIADAQNIEVLSGLKPGDSVVSGPYRILRTVNEGDLVDIQKETAVKGEERKS